ncbi:unnamed protein product, partial [Mesorhabditis spiculigera]
MRQPILIVLCMAVLVTAAKRRTAPTKDEPIIVVGAGLAGLSATLEALRDGQKVVLVEGEKNVGGNSAKASSGISACGTDAQEKAGIEDSATLFQTDTLNAGDHENDESLVRLLVEHSEDAVRFLTEAGVDLSDVNLCGGHSVPRTHWIPSPKEGRPTPVGLGIIKALYAKIQQYSEENPGKYTEYLETKVLGLSSWNEYMVGVRVRLHNGTINEIDGKGIILATGGFTADKDSEASLLLEFASDKAHLPTTNGAFARGDGVKMARAMGAQVIGMNKVQVHPTAFIDPKTPGDNTKFLAAEALRGKGALLLNSKGKRIGNELGRRDYLTGRINKECEKVESFQGGSGPHVAAIMLMTDEMADAFGRPAFGFYANVKKFFTKYDDIKAFAAALGAPYTEVEKTIREYNAIVEAEGKKKKDLFGKTVFPFAVALDKPVYAALVTPALHYTMGGLRIDRNAFVFNEFMDRSFKGLLAAGEVTGGVHGSNRLAGNSLLECVVFGRVAGRSASLIDYTGEDGIMHAEL